jgi:hypothetical protein
MTDNENQLNKNHSSKTGDIILTVLFFISMGLTIWGINIYRLTIIDAKYLLVPTIFGVIVALTILAVLKSRYSRFWTLLIKAAIGSGIFYFGFLFLNQRLADKHMLTEGFKIVEKGSFPQVKKSRCSKPYAVIDFYKTKKQLVFYCDYAEIIKHSTKVNLTYSKGGLGFIIIKSKELVQ